MATQEYENMKEHLDLEQSLRHKAETYAHEVCDKTYLIHFISTWLTGQLQSMHTLVTSESY